MKEMLKENLYQILDKKISIEEIVIEIPKDRKMGDLAIPCFLYSKILKQNPNEIALFISKELDSSNYEKIEVINGYINLFFNKTKFTKETLEEIIEKKENYANNNVGNNKTIVMDYSAPNIAKPFGVGHLRSTVIGNALKNICKKNGYNVVSINYLGDWGTQFGKLIAAYKKWGNEDSLKQNPIEELKNLYVRFHEEAKVDESLEEEGRRCFKLLEDNDEESLNLWKRFREVSLLEFEKTYKLLNIDKFDSYEGESFFNDKTENIVNELIEKNLLEESDNAKIVRLQDDMPPALIKKSDGATLYITRDLAAVLYRKEKYKFDEMLYVVGNEQTLHFNQLKLLLNKMGYPWFEDIKHISFGMILQDGKKMSTRHGKSIKLHDVLIESINLAKQYIEERTNSILDRQEVSEKIGVGAVIFNDLKNYRTGDIEFNLEEILKFEGETGPYIQYTYARTNSLLENKKDLFVNYDNIDISDFVWNIIFRLYNFKEVIIKSKQNYDPSEIAKYLIDLAQDFNKFYANEKIVDENSEFKLKISEAVSIVLKEGMNILGIRLPNKM